MRLLGLDIGERRIGVAFGDSELRLATPVDVIERRSLVEDARAVGAFMRKYDATQLIVGLPRNVDGTLGAQAEAVTREAEQLARALDVPLVLWDERLTTVEAEQRTRAPGTPTQGLRRAKKSRRALDAIAAAVILQDFVDSQGSESK